MPITLEDLRHIDLLDDLDEAQLAEWVALAEERELPDGGLLADETDEVPPLVFLLEGEARTIRIDGDRPTVVGRQHAPTWMGAVAILTGGMSGVRIVADGTCRIAAIGNEDARRLALAHPDVLRRVMRQVRPVVGSMARLDADRERLASLGTMSAGLAHELNNPAAAAKRAAADMQEALDVLGASLGHFVEAGVPLEDARELVRLQRAAIDGARGRTALDALDAADAEDELLDHLESLGVEGAWRLAEPLSGAGLDAAWVDEVATHAGAALDAALGWVASSITARTLAAELQQATEQLSTLVGAIKTYTYMDRGGALEVDLHEGLETTLVVLGHKLKQTQIEVVRAYDRTLPRVQVHGPELNQVWTNLLDNAIDALGTTGTITISTRDCEDGALVTIADDGPGMPAEVREHLFDEFFTTKDVGKGTGLGLSTAWRIVVDRHEGTIGVDSKPGRTAFEVWLPYTTAPVS